MALGKSWMWYRINLFYKMIHTLIIWKLSFSVMFCKILAFIYIKFNCYQPCFVQWNFSKSFILQNSSCTNRKEVLLEAVEVCSKVSWTWVWKIYKAVCECYVRWNRFCALILKPTDMVQFMSTQLNSFPAKTWSWHPNCLFGMVSNPCHPSKHTQTC